MALDLRVPGGGDLVVLVAGVDSLAGGPALFHRRRVGERLPHAPGPVPLAVVRAFALMGPVSVRGMAGDRQLRGWFLLSLQLVADSVCECADSRVLGDGVDRFDSLFHRGAGGLSPGTFYGSISGRISVDGSGLYLLRLSLRS